MWRSRGAPVLTPKYEYQVYVLSITWPSGLHGGGIEEVYRLVLICRLRWWEARMQRSRGGGGFDPKRRILSVCAQYDLAIGTAYQGV